MAQEGQGETQPVAQQPLPDNMSEREVIGVLQQAFEAQETQEKPRDEKGRFTKPEEEVPAEEAPAEEAKAEEETPAEEAPAEEEKPTKRSLKLKYRGEEKEIDEDEAVELAQKGYDYTQKMQQLAKEREEATASARKAAEEARKQYETQLEVQRQLVLKLADQEALTANLAEIALQDPAKALQLQLRRQQIAETYQAVVAEQQKLIQQKESEGKEQYQKQAREAVERLQERIPNWNNNLYGDILKSAVTHYGFKQEEVNAITDHRAIEVLNDARQWREYQSAKPKTVDKRVAAVPKVQKPGSTEKSNPNADRMKASMAKLQKSGHRDDAVDYVQSLIETGRL